MLIVQEPLRPEACSTNQILSIKRFLFTWTSYRGINIVRLTCPFWRVLQKSTCPQCSPFFSSQFKNSFATKTLLNVKSPSAITVSNLFNQFGQCFYQLCCKLLSQLNFQNLGSFCMCVSSLKLLVKATFYFGFESYVDSAHFIYRKCFWK